MSETYTECPNCKRTGLNLRFGSNGQWSCIVCGWTEHFMAAAKRGGKP